MVDKVRAHRILQPPGRPEFRHHALHARQTCGCQRYWHGPLSTQHARSNAALTDVFATRCRNFTSANASILRRKVVSVQNPILRNRRTSLAPDVDAIHVDRLRK